MEKLENQTCPMCGKNTLTMAEDTVEVPYFGKTFLLSMTCSNCKYHKSDIEPAEEKEPSKYTLEVDGEEDMKIRVVKSASATVKIPHIMTIESGESSNGYVTNVEGIINRVKSMLEFARDEEEDNSSKKKIKNMIKKLQKVLWGNEKLKIIIEDPTGNSAIISDKAKKDKLKIKK